MGNNFRTEITVRGHTIIADEPEDAGGTNTGPTPMELMLGALGACVAITLKLYADRKGWPLEGVETAQTHEKYKKDDYPAYEGEALFVNEIRQQIVLHGPLTDDQCERLLEIAGKCPVSRVITDPTFIVKELLRAEGLPE
jgi:putative redox protein